MSHLRGRCKGQLFLTLVNFTRDSDFANGEQFWFFDMLNVVSNLYRFFFLTLCGTFCHIFNIV